MNAWSGDGYQAPVDHAELFEQYHGLVEHMVRKAGIVDRDVEDVTSELIVKFMEPRTCPSHKEPKRRCRGVVVRRKNYEQLVRCAPGGWMDLYDAKLVHETDSGPKQARFVSFLRRFVSLHVRQHLDRQRAQVFREALRVEELEHDTQVLWLEMYMPVDVAVEDAVAHDVALRAWVQEAHAYLLSLPQRGRKDLARAFELVVAQWVADPGSRIDRRALEREFGMSDAYVGSMLADLRRALWDGGFVPERFAT